MSDSIIKTELIEENRNLHIGKKVLTVAFIVIFSCSAVVCVVIVPLLIPIVAIENGAS